MRLYLFHKQILFNTLLFLLKVCSSGEEACTVLMADHPVTRYEEDFFICLQSAFSRTDVHQDIKKHHRPLLETKLLKTQIQYQGKFAWLKRNKKGIQSLKTNLYYTPLPSEQFDSFMTAATHKGSQRWLPFPWSSAEADLCSDTDLHTTHKESQ